MDLSAFPSAGTTGPDAGVRLRPSSSFQIVEAGTVIENVEVTGQIDVGANDVTIRNVKINATGLYGVRSLPGMTGLVIENVEIVGVTEKCSAGVAPNQYTARRVEVSGCEDGFKVGNNTTIEGSWVHSLRYSGGAHNDAIQAVGGSNIQILRNRLDGPWQAQTSAMILHSDLLPLEDVRIAENLISGGTYSLYVKAKPGMPEPRDVVVEDNVWIRDSYKFGSHNQTGAGVTWRGNRFEDGTSYSYDTN
ncbi:MAG: hypothetical protein AB7N61_20780 [Acidimicrobiia bacterium]